MNTYFKRYAYPVKLFTAPPDDSLKISVVIPCYKEPDILTTLNSLNNCTPVSGVEVIIIVNESEDSHADIRRQNQTTIADIEKWQSRTNLNFRLFTYHLTAPGKDAGVGFARKVGMDEAARRFELLGIKDGVICCFDADSTCLPNYLEVVHRQFYLMQSKPHGAAIYFEHVSPVSSSQIEGITQYELHLRYYVHALRLMGYPYAHQTVGSSMIVRADIYKKIGGMNKRKAGEDFYFLHRLMPTGNFIDITETTIYPSARISDRVPFGTGKAMYKWHSEKPTSYLTYNLQSFQDLKILFAHAEDFYKLRKNNIEKLISELPASINSFLLSDGFIQVVDRLNSQSSNLSNFIKKWYQYFDGFKVLKYLHFARNNYYKNMPVIEEAATLASLLWPADTTKCTNASAWLKYYRQKDKQA